MPLALKTGAGLKAGPIVTVDCREDPGDSAPDPHPPEPNRIRPAVVVQDTELIDRAYPTAQVVLTIGGLS